MGDNNGINLHHLPGCCFVFNLQLSGCSNFLTDLESPGLYPENKERDWAVLYRVTHNHLCPAGETLHRALLGCCQVIGLDTINFLTEEKGKRDSLLPAKKAIVGIMEQGMWDRRWSKDRN